MNAALAPSPLRSTDSTRLMRAFGASCAPMPNEVKYESLRMLRAPGFSIPFLLMPVPVYLFFGVVIAAPAVATNPGVVELPLLRVLGVRGHGPCALWRRLRARGRAR